MDENLEKLKALMEGLEIEHIDEFIENVGVEDFRNFGRLVADQVRSAIIDHSPADEYQMLKTLKRRGMIK